MEVVRGLTCKKGKQILVEDPLKMIYLQWPISSQNLILEFIDLNKTNR
jgi:hypothetical protein